MSFQKAENHLKKLGLEDRIIVTDHSSATVSQAAEALGCRPEMIAKSISLLQGDEPVLILTEGTAKIDNQKYKAEFFCKAKMIPFDSVEEAIGHPAGGVCPFGINENVKVYLDESLKKYEVVYPAAGDDHSAVKLKIDELEKCSGYIKWVDVCKSV